jgi:glucokinase
MTDNLLPNSPFVPPLVVGVDVGGTKIAASLVDKQGSLLGHVRCPTDITSPEATLDSIACAVFQAIQKCGLSREHVQAAGFGIPGVIDPVNGIGIASVNLNWRDVPVKAGLEARLGLPCSIENDVKAAAMGEARYGAGKNLHSLVFMTIGTGIAAGIVLDNKIYRGANGMAGEIGHTVIDREGPLCKCGGYGCFEALASGPAIAARAVQKVGSGRQSILSVVAEQSVELLTAEDIFSAAAQEDELALETITEVGEYVAFAIQFIALAYDPQVIVLGGGVPQAGQLFLDPILRSLARVAAQNWVFAKLFGPGFVRVTQLGEDIGVLGAAALAVSAR